MAWSARCGSLITAAAGPATVTDRQQTTSSDATRWRVVPMRATPFRASARPSERPPSAEVVSGRHAQTPAAEFEAADRGVAIGRRFIPWHRVRRYEWDLPPKEFAEEHRVSARVRLVLDDVNGTAEEHLVSADGFETGAFAVTMLLDDVVDTDHGTVMVRRVGIPWHHAR